MASANLGSWKSLDPEIIVMTPIIYSCWKSEILEILQSGDVGMPLNIIVHNLNTICQKFGRVLSSRGEKNLLTLFGIILTFFCGPTNYIFCGYVVCFPLWANRQPLLLSSLGGVVCRSKGSLLRILSLGVLGEGSTWDLRVRPAVPAARLEI